MLQELGAKADPLNLTERGAIVDISLNVAVR